eukprot:1003003-Pyramimonas_sp.AAC.1
MRVVTFPKVPLHPKCQRGLQQPLHPCRGAAAARHAVGASQSPLQGQLWNNAEGSCAAPRASRESCLVCSRMPNHASVIFAESSLLGECSRSVAISVEASRSSIARTCGRGRRIGGPTAGDSQWGKRNKIAILSRGSGNRRRSN